MKNLTVALCLLFMSLNIFAAEDSDCDDISKQEKRSFKLYISMSFHGLVSFELCRSKELHILNIRRTLPPAKNEDQSILSQINLSDGQIKTIKEKLFKAMKYNTLDDGMGLDGSHWCLLTERGFTNISACFWTPSNKPEERGLTGLHELGVYLWEISELKKENIRLY